MVTISFRVESNDCIGSPIYEEKIYRELSSSLDQRVNKDEGFATHGIQYGSLLGSSGLIVGMTVNFHNRHSSRNPARVDRI